MQTNLLDYAHPVGYFGLFFHSINVKREPLILALVLNRIIFNYFWLFLTENYGTYLYR